MMKAFGSAPLSGGVRVMVILQNVTSDYSDKQMFEQHIGRHAGGQQIRILEAGCGRRWGLSLGDTDFELTGVDINGESMRLRQEKHGDLDRTVVGDLRTVELEPETYDIVFCSFLLEHVAGAEQVLDRLFAALKPGGLLLLRVPDRDGVYGWVARHTPHRFHIWYKRTIRGSRNAGTPGHGPFPVVYDKIISWTALNEYCVREGHTILEAMASNDHMDFFPRSIRPAVDAVLKGVAALSFGRPRPNTRTYSSSFRSSRLCARPAAHGSAFEGVSWSRSPSQTRHFACLLRMVGSTRLS